MHCLIAIYCQLGPNYSRWLCIENELFFVQFSSTNTSQTMIDKKTHRVSYVIVSFINCARNSERLTKPNLNSVFPSSPM